MPSFDPLMDSHEHPEKQNYGEENVINRHHRSFDLPASRDEAPSIAESAPRMDAVPLDTPENEGDFAHGITLVTVVSALILSMFLASLDMTILATAIPSITAQFHSLNDVGWYGSAFFLTLASSTPAWGKSYKYFDLKTVFLIAISVFEVGSLICAGTSNPFPTCQSHQLIVTISVPKFHYIDCRSSDMWSRGRRRPVRMLYHYRIFRPSDPSSHVHGHTGSDIRN
jgi:hypothetical protein